MMAGYIAIAATVAAAVVCLAAFFVARRHYEKRMKETYRHLLETLDRALSGKRGDVRFDESMDAALTERLNRLLRAYDVNHDAAGQERDAMKTLISDISHQIRTPLANIMLYSDLLREKETEGEGAALAGRIRSQSEKLDFFMKELVRTSYIQQEMISMSPSVTDAEKIVDMACQMVELAAMKKNITILRNSSDERCCADSRWTAEALGNVLDNAVKYSDEGSSVQVETVPYESFVCIQVRDFGPGIREDEQGKIFQRFYRSDDARDKPGFGIGLYLVREILGKQGGYVKVESEPGKGTTMKLFLPRYGELAGGNGPEKYL